ncbi:MAG: small ribosomal subunit biogenesis GTPase RsgA, partial [Halieaceae bacterium]|nr:small ribosomal subunit biogenesis GTPase RsgA [Halieaceae bacterium]
MSKRKLTRRQTWRINKIQEERRRRADRHGEGAADAPDESALGPEQQGLVIAHFGTQVLVEETATGDGDARRHRCHLRANLDSIVTGDRVVWRAGDSLGVVVARQPRQSELLRPDSLGRLKPVAANVDQMIIVIAPLPEPHANLIDRYLVAAECSGMAPVILLNKSDLLADGAHPEIETLLAPYRRLGYPVLSASSRSRDGLRDLLAAMKDRSSVFVGQSGVGKSSLVGSLLPDMDVRIGELSEGRDKGTHTTTTAFWYHLPEGGAIIDSPGIREFGLWHVQRGEIEQGFREFRPLLGHCKFR